MTKIVSISGTALPTPNAPNPDVVRTLQRYLKLAEDGELKGIVISGIYRNDDAGSAWAGTLSIQMLGSVHLLLHTLTASLAEHDAEDK